MKNRSYVVFETSSGRGPNLIDETWLKKHDKKAKKTADKLYYFMIVFYCFTSILKSGGIF